MSDSLPLDELTYMRLAERYRPHDIEQLARAVRDLAAQGCTESDIGSSLRLAPGAVRALLYGQRPC